MRGKRLAARANDSLPPAPIVGRIFVSSHNSMHGSEGLICAGKPDSVYYQIRLKWSCSSSIVAAAYSRDMSGLLALPGLKNRPFLINSAFGTEQKRGD